MINTKSNNVKIINTKMKVTITLALVLLVLVAGIGIGSVYIAPFEILKILGGKLIPPFSESLLADVNVMKVSILWKIRLPRTLLAFLVGAALAVSGAVMQSVLKNPLASSYTLGISSGASFGAALVILVGLKLPFMGALTVPLAGLVCGLLTVFLALGLSARIDRNLETHTIILTGMVFSLFVSALLTLVMALFKGEMQRLIYWQMGSFSLKEWMHVWILAPVVLLSIFFLMFFSFELDICTFGEEQAQSMGVDIKRLKWVLLTVSSALTGFSISFVGIIGFVDLITPHVVRRIFGSAHRVVLPMSALLGGAFMVAADLLARTLISPSELPVGAVTAIIGALFFAYIFFKKGK